jgi:uncharacterized protein (TIGR03435 family)
LPSWIDTERFDVTVEGPGPGPRLQAVLSDRFQLKFHHESKEMPVYFLVVSKGGPHLRSRKEGEAAFDATKNGTSPFKPGLASLFKGCDLPAFAERLGRPLDRPIVDKTGIKGEYWFQLEWQDILVIDQKVFR